MSWSMPAQGQWGTGAAMMTPDMMNAGSYTPEQWVVAQQNWQQWQQWQQQYAQWQTQYGEKYAQQMQAMQAAGAAPPAPPPSAPPPAPPPPDQPPPPLPYENNQPLYGKPAPPQPTPVPAPAANRASNLTNVNVIAGNAQNQWSYDAKDTPPPPTQTQTQTVNTDALKKLAEEEKLFDIQFQKWEEEIDKWRKENVNHPDKAAYKEYEQKFEACRAQLLERRQQMQLKRARLTSNAPITAPASGNTSAVPPPNLNTPNLNTPNNTYNQSQGYNNRQDYQNQQQGYGKKPDQNYPNTNATYKQFNNPPNSNNYNNRGNRGTIDPQDRYESYEATDNYAAEEDYPSNKSSFLPTSGASKSIPGLDLVPDTDKSQAVAPPEVIDITGDQAIPQKAPDYSTISKGISHILGDEKIMNILSSLQGHRAPERNTAQNAQPVHQNNLNVPPPPNQQWNRNNNYNNQQYGNKNMPFNNRPNQNPMQQNQDPGYQDNRFNPSQDRYDNREENSEQDMYYNRNNQYGGPNNMPPRNNQGPNFPQRNDQGPNFPPRNNQGSNFPQGPNFPTRNDNGPNFPPRNDMGPNFRPRNDSGSNFQGQDPNLPSRYNQAQGPNFQPRNEQAPNHQGPGYNAPPSLLDLPMQSGGNFQRGPPSLLQNPPPQPPKPKWVEEPLFTASIIVEYEHKPLRVKGRTFLEPVHTFDYDHKSKESENRKKDFEREADEMFSRLPRREKENAYMSGRFEHSERQRDPYNKDFERRLPREPREEARDDYRNRPVRDDFEERRPDDRFFDRRRDDRDRYPRREDSFRDRERERERDREKERDYHRDRHNRDSHRRDDANHRSRSRDKDSRKRELSKESETASKKSRDSSHDIVADKPKHVVMIDDILEPPGREMRPEKIVIILRGPPGSGKSYLAKLIRDREAEYGGTARIMSIDDYFMQEGEIEEKDPTTGKVIKKPTLKYEYDEKQEETYINSLKRAFKRSLTDGYFTFLIYDAVNDHLRSYADIWNFARQNGFQAYVCTTEIDPQASFKRNIHNRSLEDIQVICSRFFPTPGHHIQLDASTLLQSAAITEVTMEDADDEVIMEDAQEPEVESVFTSKWEKMDDAAQLAKLDGTNKPLRPSQLSMADYLQLDDWTPSKAQPGKKTVRWADIEESRQQEKMRAIGFVVGQTDWNRMTDPTMGSSALTQTKYIERVRRT